MAADVSSCQCDQILNALKKLAEAGVFCASAKLSQPLPAAQNIAAMGVKCTVTWGKQVFKDVEVDTSQTPETFKSQLFSLTGVPPDRQKIMGLKGGLLKDSADWQAVGLKPGQKLMLMGTADKVAFNG